MTEDVYGYLVRAYMGKVVDLDDIRKKVERDNYDPKEVMNYLVRTKRAIRIYKDVYFIKGWNKYFVSPEPMERILGAAMGKLGWSWYYGLESAWFNGRCAQQAYPGYIIINDRVTMTRKINGEKVIFIKSKRKEMFEFGIEKDSWGLLYSDVEKTLLDFIYFANYGRVPQQIVFEAIDSFFDDTNFYMIRRKRSYKKLKKYLRYYPDFVRADLEFYLKDWVYPINPKLKAVFA